MLGRRQESSASLFFEPRALAADGDDVAVMQQAVEDRGRDDGIAEDLTLLADGPIRGQQDAAAFIATADELEEGMGRIRLDGQVAQFIDDPQFGFGKVEELLVEAPLRVRLDALRDERRGARKQHRVAGGDRGATEPGALVRLSDTGWTEEEQ